MDAHSDRHSSTDATSDPQGPPTACPHSLAMPSRQLMLSLPLLVAQLQRQYFLPDSVARYDFVAAVVAPQRSNKVSPSLRPP